MEKYRATLKDVAEKSGFALRTVKKVMSGTETVSEKTRLAVMHAAKELNYQRNVLASALSKGKNTRIAIVYAETTKTYFPEVERGFKKFAEEYRDYGLIIEFHKAFDRNIDSQVAVLKELIDKNSIDGLIIQPMSRSRINPYIDELARKGKPVITFGADASSDNRLSYIGPNAYKSGRIGAQILANYIGKSGNVAVISDNNEHMQTVDRIKGFEDRVREHYPDISITNLNIPVNSDLYYEMVKTLVTKNAVQGIFCTDANSYIAGEVLRDLNQKDPVIVGFDISEMAKNLLKEGYLKVIIEQNPFQFSYMALKSMFNYIYMNEKPQEIQYTDLSILTSECLGD
jgi:LacI family transcriptional regulator